MEPNVTPTAIDVEGGRPDLEGVGAAGIWTTLQASVVWQQRVAMTVQSKPFRPHEPPS